MLLILNHKKLHGRQELRNIIMQNLKELKESMEKEHLLKMIDSIFI
jgi:hypothetical protein